VLGQRDADGGVSIRIDSISADCQPKAGDGDVWQIDFVGEHNSTVLQSWRSVARSLGNGSYIDPVPQEALGSVTGHLSAYVTLTWATDNSSFLDAGWIQRCARHQVFAEAVASFRPCAGPPGQHGFLIPWQKWANTSAKHGAVLCPPDPHNQSTYPSSSDRMRCYNTRLTPRAGLLISGPAAALAAGARASYRTGAHSGTHEQARSARHGRELKGSGAGRDARDSKSAHVIRGGASGHELRAAGSGREARGGGGSGHESRFCDSGSPGRWISAAGCSHARAGGARACGGRGAIPSNDSSWATWVPWGCDARPRCDGAGIRACLGPRRILFLGDSVLFGAFLDLCEAFRGGAACAFVRDPAEVLQQLQNDERRVVFVPLFALPPRQGLNNLFGKVRPASVLAARLGRRKEGLDLVIFILPTVPNKYPCA
jgi:hypothetical protein